MGVKPPEMFHLSKALHEKCPYLEFFWSVFSLIWTEYREMRSICFRNLRFTEFWKLYLQMHLCNFCSFKYIGMHFSLS